MKKIISFLLGMASSVLFCDCAGKATTSIRGDSSLGLRVSDFNGTEYLWHSGFDLPEGDWDLYMGTQTEIPTTVGPLANYDIFSFPKVSLGMSCQELVATLGDPSEQWTVPIPEKNKKTIGGLPLVHMPYSYRRSHSHGFLNIPALKKYLVRLGHLRSATVRRSIVATAKTGSPIFLYYSNYPEFIFYVATVKLPIGTNPDRQGYNTVSFLQDIYDLYALSGRANGLPLTNFIDSSSRNVYKIRSRPDKDGKKIEEVSPLRHHSGGP